MSLVQKPRATMMMGWHAHDMYNYINICARNHQACLHVYLLNYIGPCKPYIITGHLCWGPDIRETQYFGSWPFLKPTFLPLSCVACVWILLIKILSIPRILIRGRKKKKGVRWFTTPFQPYKRHYWSLSNISLVIVIIAGFCWFKSTFCRPGAWWSEAVLRLRLPAWTPNSSTRWPQRSRASVEGRYGLIWCIEWCTLW